MRSKLVVTTKSEEGLRWLGSCWCMGRSPARGAGSRCCRDCARRDTRSTRSTCPAPARIARRSPRSRSTPTPSACARSWRAGPPAVLVGHSMGGMVITQAAARSPRQIRSLIYVAAFLPADGQSLLDLTAYPEAADDQVQANLVIDGDPPVATMPPAAARGALFGCCDDEQAAWGVAQLGGQPVVPFGQPVSLGDPPAAAFAALGRAYITCLRDRAIPPAMQRRMFEAGGLRSGDRDRHRSFALDLAHRRAGGGARSAGRRPRRVVVTGRAALAAPGATDWRVLRLDAKSRPWRHPQRRRCASGQRARPAAVAARSRLSRRRRGPSRRRSRSPVR